MKSLDKIINHETIDQVKKPAPKKINGFSVLNFADQSQNTDTVNIKDNSAKHNINKNFHLNANVVDNLPANKVTPPENTTFNQKNTTVLDSSLIKENPNIKGALIPKPDTYAELIKTSNELKM